MKQKKKKKPSRKRAPKRNPVLSPSDKRALAKAKALSESFHGRAEVVELNASERKPLPRYVAVIGRLTASEYVPPRGSKRAGATYRHESGDRGPFMPRSKADPLLVADPNTKRPALVKDRSSMKLTDRGLIG